MSVELNGSLTVQDAHQMLSQFTCVRDSSVEAIASKHDLQQALLQVSHQSDYQILGICADDLDQGQAALNSYAQALGYEPQTQLHRIEGPIYIKFNPKSGLCYVDSYKGDHRGVLVSCQSAYESGINAMYGHLPLDLFL